MINVDKIKRGVVLDHIEAGTGIKLFHALKLDALKEPVVLLTNISSKKHGRKDLIKIETEYEPDVTVLGLVSPDTTVNVVVDGELKKKYRLGLPKTVEGILKCANPSCVTNVETVGQHRFHLVDPEKRTYACEYCDHIQAVKE